MASSATIAAPPTVAVTRHRLAGLQQQLASLVLEAVQEGGAVVRLSAGEADATGSAAPAVSATAGASSDTLPSLESPLRSLRISSSFVCSTCRVAFELGEELRLHARTAWHVHNVRAASRAEASSASHARKQEDPETAILTELQFEELQQKELQQSGAKKGATASADASSDAAASAGGAAAEDDSASSGLSSDDEAGGARRGRSSSAEEDVTSSAGSSRVTFFTPTQRVTVWKAMLLSPSDPSILEKHVPLTLKAPGYARALRGLGAELATANVAVIMVSGGRFSAAVWKGEQLLVSKSYQRYTTRRKQGGSQSAHDASKGAAQSIGASIRRKETVRFWEEAGRVLGEWSSLLSACARIFLFAPGANRQQLLRPSVLPVDKRDPRLRAIPFPTHRPTLGELQRIHLWLSTVEFEEREMGPPSDLDKLLREQETRQTAPAAAAAGKKQHAAAAAAAASAATPAAPVSALASLPARVLDDAALNAVRSGDLELLQSLLTSGYERPVGPRDPRFRPLLYEAVDASQGPAVAWLVLSEYIVDREGEGVDEQVLALAEDGHAAQGKKQHQHQQIVCWGALHLACARANEEIVLALLRAGADPLRRDSRNRLPAQLLPPNSAMSSSIRLAVRRLAGSSAAWETRWDWFSSEFGPPLSPEGEQAAEEARKAKAKEKKKAAAQRAKERAKEEKAELEAQALRDEEAARQAQQAAAIKASAQAVKEAANARASAQAALSDREKRALAAERRLGAAKGTGPVCALCALPITKAPFERLDFRYCSLPCLQQHKLQLDAEAAAAAKHGGNQSKTVVHNPR